MQETGYQWLDLKQKKEFQTLTIVDHRSTAGSVRKAVGVGKCQTKVAKRVLLHQHLRADLVDCARSLSLVTYDGSHLPP